MSSRRRFRLNLRAREAVNGYLFTLPFTLGFILMFLHPFVQSVLFSVSKLELSSIGYSLSFTGLENYHNALFINADFPRLLLETAGAMFYSVPLILVFSFFAAILLNQKFKGRLVARVIFFLPVILGADIILRMESADYITLFLEEGIIDVDEMTFVGREQLLALISYLKIPEQVLTYVVMSSLRVAEIIRSSGVQILIFLAGLQSIPSSHYEVAKIEGATGWECFWKVTFPLLSPLIVTNIVYSIIDFFTTPTNQLVQFIEERTFGSAGYGVSMAMSWIYFGVVALFLVLSVGLISRKVVYMDER